jgi:hypothetical protein
MSVATFEGVVEDGRILLKSSVVLPNKTRVYVLVPDLQVEQVVRIHSPRLAHPEQAADFVMEVVEGSSNAGL